MTATVDPPGRVAVHNAHTSNCDGRARSSTTITPRPSSPTNFDDATLNLICELLGDETREQRSTSTDAARRTETVTTAYRRLAPPEARVFNDLAKES